jgi:DNA-binding NtrC family response regulator
MREASQYKILVIDDEPALLRLMHTYLSRFGYQVEVCATGNEGWRKYANTPLAYDLVIADLGLPGFDMEAALPRFAELNSEIRVIVCSGFVFEPATLPRRLQANYSFLQKPFVPRLLSETVAERLNEAVEHCAVA